LVLLLVLPKLLSSPLCGAPNVCHEPVLGKVFLLFQNIYNDYFSFKLKPEDRFSKGIHDWNKFDRFADSMLVRLAWGIFYVAIYVLCISYS